MRRAKQSSPTVVYVRVILLTLCSITIEVDFFFFLFRLSSWQCNHNKIIRDVFRKDIFSTKGHGRPNIFYCDVFIGNCFCNISLECSGQREQNQMFNGPEIHSSYHVFNKFDVAGFYVPTITKVCHKLQYFWLQKYQLKTEILTKINKIINYGK